MQQYRSCRLFFQQAFFFDEVRHHIGSRRRDVNALLAVFRRAEAQAVQGPAAGRAKMSLETVVEFVGILIYFRQFLFRRVETANQGADNQTGAAQCAADAARTADAAAQAAGHADGYVGKIQVHAVVAGLDNRFDAVISF